MAGDLTDKGFVDDLLGRVVEHLEAERGQDPAQHAAGEGSATQDLTDLHEALRDAIDTEGKADHGGAYYSRHPLVSLIQSAVHEGRVTGKLTRPDEPFGPEDIKWILDIAKGLWWRLWHDRHPFRDEPACGELPDRVRVILVSDWGTGREAAATVSASMRRCIDSATTPVHVVHLGDTYYSGTPIEGREHILDHWPVRPEEKDSIGSWCLNGNHDMYSGGHGYFETVLADERFHRQRGASGDATSWFTLRSGAWSLVGLDTAWNDHLPFEWKLGHLHGGQAQEVASVAADRDRRMLLLSHHQLFATGDDSGVGSRIADALESTLRTREVDVWFWGHEHDCLAYDRHEHVESAFAIGHGAVPTRASEHTDPDWVRWRFTGSVPGEGDERWCKHGFAVLDFDGPALTVDHLDEDGNPHRESETL
jgi:Calcineurin-like phosphoesterase